METIVPQIIKTITSERLQAEIGVSSHMVRKAYQDRRFPASWFDVMERLCAEHDIPCPREAFSFKRQDQVRAAE